MTTTFGSIAVGTTFTYKNQEYVKVAEKKISCCKSINAHKVNEPKATIGLKKTEAVEVSE